LPPQPLMAAQQSYVIAPQPYVIRHRRDFLNANRGRRFVTPAFILLAYCRSGTPRGAPADQRFGITVTKKIGNAVVRNRMKRRFRALVREILPQHGLAGHDHIMIGRAEGREHDFAAMRADLIRGLVYLKRKAQNAAAPPR
jgi:ribonuclease P protein component